ncbi:hypothetical protein ACQZ40_20125 [Agrobacterium sp. 16-172Ci]
MSTYSDKTTFYAYHHKDDPSKLVTELYESQGAATSGLYDLMERKVTDVEFDRDSSRSYSARYREFNKARRAAAKKLAGDDYLLVTYRLVRNGEEGSSK